MSLSKLAFAFCLLPALVACGPDCVALCEEAEAEDCDGYDTPDCERECSELDDIAFESECEEDLDAVLECFADLEDICEANDDCDGELEDFSDCVAEFCAEHPGNRECEGASL